MAKKFLDNVGLAKYNAKIKEYIDAQNDAVKQLVGETPVTTQIETAVSNAKT